MREAGWILRTERMITGRKMLPVLPRLLGTLQISPMLSLTGMVTVCIIVVMVSTRLWSNRGEEWIRMDCEWQGPDSGTLPLKLWDTGGLCSGTWVMQMLISD